MKLENQVVILTGASAGIGRATAEMLAQAGCRLALAARGEAELQALADHLTRQGSQVVVIPTDMADTGQAARLVEKTVAAFGRLDVVINNAALGVRDNVIDLQEAEARRVMDVNYFGPLALIQAALPHLQGNPAGGLIINVSSIVGRRAMPGLAGYCASKAALEKMADSLRVELSGSNIRVSTIYPGVTQTAFNDNSLGESPFGRGRRAGVPPEQVALVIARTIRREPRDVFITWFDRAFVTAAIVWPGLMDRLLSGYARRSGN